MRRHSAHVDPDVLAELSAGLISGRRATRIHAHLAGCEQCAGVTARLSAVSVLLAAVPSPAMPESVTRRLSSALAEEAAARSATAAAATAQARRTVFRHHPERDRGVPSRLARGPLRPLRPLRPLGLLTRGPVAARAFAAAAAACVLAVGGYTVMQLTSHGPAASTGPAGTGSGHFLGPNRGPGGNGPNGAGGKGGFLTPQPGGIPGRPAVLSKFPVVQSGTDYQATRLAAQIENELDLAAQGHGSSGGPEHLSTIQQEDCVYGVTGGNRPTLVDDARYEGQPVTVIALAPSATQLGQAWIVGPRCSAETNDTLKRVELSRAAG